MRGLSGGERRRLSIAVGVVSAPSIIFLDEPTSGLDSFAALNVMQYMKSMAELRGHTIIASIHQPRIGIWNMFDKVCIALEVSFWGKYGSSHLEMLLFKGDVRLGRTVALVCIQGQCQDISGDGAPLHSLS